jgi:dipeptidyl aminopeptidase/acylaminoacyl peptidase
MKISGLTGASALALFVFFGLAAAPANALPPIESFGDLPAIAQPALTPDGKHYAVVEARQGRPIIAIYQVGAPEGTAPARVGAGDGRIATMRWATNDWLVVILKANMRVSGDNRVRTWWRSISVDVTGKRAAIMLNNVPDMRYNFGAAAIADVDIAHPGYVYMPLYAVNDGQNVVLNLYKVDVTNGGAAIAQYGIMWTTDYVMDGNGHIAARIDVYPNELTYHVKVPSGGRDWREIGVFQQVNGETSFAGLSADGLGLSLLTYSPQQMVGISRLDPSTMAVTPLYANPSYDVANTIRDEWTGRVIGAAYVADKMEFIYFDPVRQRLQSALERAFPGHIVSIETCDQAVDLCIVMAESPQDPRAYYMFNVATMHAVALGNSYPQLTPADLGAMKPYNYAARDGLQIPAYLTLPPGRDAKNLPLVVFPHGGPDARDFLEFNWWAQFMASRGYAVLQPNFRGSSGYGRDFTRQGAHQWGLKMQDDLADGVAKLVADGIVDSKRVCIVGASYGGYAALAAAAFGGATYACAASFAGIGDLDAMLHREELDNGRDSADVAFWKSRIGDRHSDADAARIDATSPIRHVDKIAIPILLLHATGDTTVPIAQSRDMRDALQRAHKNVTYVEIDGDDHYLDLAATRIRVLSEIEKFLAANIGR